jgi:LysM repeat protein
MNRQSKSALLSIFILVTIWVFIIYYWPRQAAGSSPDSAAETPAPIDPFADPGQVEPRQAETPVAIEVPPPIETPTPSPVPTPPLVVTVQHVIQTGETLLSIAEQHHAPVGLLAGSLRVEQLAPGNTITVLAPNPAACPSLRLHLVVENETLYSLALRYSVSLDSLMRANGLSEPLIMAGQMLCVPAP